MCLCELWSCCTVHAGLVIRAGACSIHAGLVIRVGAVYYSCWFGFHGVVCVLFMLVWLGRLFTIHAGLVIRAGAVCYSYWFGYQRGGCVPPYWFGYQGGGSVLFMLVWLSGWGLCAIHTGLVIRVGAV